MTPNDMNRSPKQSSRGFQQPPRLLLLMAPVPALSLWGRHAAGGASPEPRRGGTAAMQLLASLARGSGRDNLLQVKEVGAAAGMQDGPGPVMPQQRSHRSPGARLGHRITEPQGGLGWKGP